MHILLSKIKLKLIDLKIMHFNLTLLITLFCKIKPPSSYNEQVHYDFHRIQIGKIRIRMQQK